MQALTFHDIKTIRYESVPDPEIKEPTDVIVQVRLTAICGSDLHPYHGREKGLDPGTIMGHEFVGEIVEIGPEVRKFKSGDVVCSPFTTNCGRCFYCRIGLTARCAQGQLFGWVERGAGLHGGQAEYVRLPLADATLVKVPEGVTLEEALLLGDNFSTGYFCASMAEIEPEGTYVVVGCGPVGLMAILAAREMAAEKLYAVDSVPERLALAREFGAVAVNYQAEDAVSRVKEVTEGRGAGAVLEVVGSPQATRTAYELVRPGGVIAIAGVHTETHFAISPVQAYDKNLTIKTGRCPARYYMEKLRPMVQAKKYDIASIVTHRLPLSEGAQAYSMFDQKQNGCVKVVLQP